MGNYMLYPQKYRKHNHDAPVFKQIKRIKKKCEECGGKDPVGLVGGRVLCGKCCDNARYKIRCESRRRPR